jgi:hypothetical protein
VRGIAAKPQYFPWRLGALAVQKFLTAKTPRLQEAWFRLRRDAISHGIAAFVVIWS